MEGFETAISRHIWDLKYRHREQDRLEPDLAATHLRVARALAAVDSRPEEWEPRFFHALENFRFLPGGRILFGAGTTHRVTLFNCFVMGVVEDSLDGIFEGLREGALTLQQGGGVGYDFSTLRPRGTPALHTGTIASGPVSFMRIWDAMCATMLSTGVRRGAMMATLRCDHPDIEEFVTAKHTPGELLHFNLSVQVTDAFMEAVRNDAEWPLLFPDAHLGPGEGERIVRAWSGSPEPLPCRVLRRVNARALWDRIMRSAYDFAEPGVLFIDQVNRENNLAWRERISATNPCGEIPLPPYGACDLGSVNLAAFVTEPFTPEARLDIEAVIDTARIGVRMLDNVIEASQFPLPRQAEMAHGTRRVGLGVTGLADALLMLGLHYGSPKAREFAAGVMRALRDTAYDTSADLAGEKGPFPFFKPERYLERPFIQRLPEPLRRRIAAHGIRNSHLLAIAPTGTISLLANNISSGIEPVFAWSHTRRVLEADGSYTEYPLTDRAWRLWRDRHPGDAPLPGHFISARGLSPDDHLEMMAAVQPFVDNAVSKTVNVPESLSFEAFRSLYRRAHALGLKGCTTFRPSAVRGAVLREERGAEEGLVEPHCCSLEREAD